MGLVAKGLTVGLAPCAGGVGKGSWPKNDKFIINDVSRSSVVSLTTGLGGRHLTVTANAGKDTVLGFSFFPALNFFKVGSLLFFGQPFQ